MFMKVAASGVVAAPFLYASAVLAESDNMLLAGLVAVTGALVGSVSWYVLKQAPSHLAKLEEKEKQYLQRSENKDQIHKGEIQLLSEAMTKNTETMARNAEKLVEEIKEGREQAAERDDQRMEFLQQMLNGRNGNGNDDGEPA